MFQIVHYSLSGHFWTVAYRTSQSSRIIVYGVISGNISAIYIFVQMQNHWVLEVKQIQVLTQALSRLGF